MQTIFLYLFKMTLCSGVLFLYYFLFLKDKKFHQYNRFYLLFSVTLSIFLPVITIPVSWQNTSLPALFYFKSLAPITIGANINAGGAFDWASVQSVLVIIYFLVSAVLFGVMITSILKIAGIRRKYPAKELGGARFYNTNEKNTPFSFLNTIYWNSQLDLDSEKGQQVFRHELFHIKQLHSADLIFMQTVLSIAWINPFFYFIKKELSTIHEYLADQFAISGNDGHTYAEFLITNALKQKQDIPIVHYFFHSQLKRRITMILNSNNSRFSYMRRIMSIPLLVAIFCSFSLKSQLPANSQIPGEPEAQTGINPRTITLQEPEFQGGSTAWNNFMIKNLKYPQQAQDKKTQGTVIIKFIVNVDGMVENPVISADPGNGLGEEGLRIIKLSSGKWNPAVHEGQKVRASKEQPFVFRLQ